MGTDHWAADQTRLHGHTLEIVVTAGSGRNSRLG